MQEWRQICSYTHFTQFNTTAHNHSLLEDEWTKVLPLVGIAFLS